MPKAIEKIPETLAELEAFLPELVVQAREEGRKSVDIEVLKAETRTECASAHNAEKERIMGLMMAMCGDEIGVKIKTVIETGITPEMYKAIGATVLTKPESSEETLKAQLLTSLKDSGAGNPGSGDGLSSGTPKDWSAAVDAYQKENKCTRSEAIKAIESSNPGLRETYLARINTKGGK